MERSHLPPAKPAQLLTVSSEVKPASRRHQFPPLHERATPAEKPRLNAYLHTGRFDKAARLCGCSLITVSRTWDRFRRDIAGTLGL